MRFDDDSFHHPRVRSGHVDKRHAFAIMQLPTASEAGGAVCVGAHRRDPPSSDGGKRQMAAVIRGNPYSPQGFTPPQLAESY